MVLWKQKHGKSHKQCSFQKTKQISFLKVLVEKLKWQKNKAWQTLEIMVNLKYCTIKDKGFTKQATLLLKISKEANATYIMWSKKPALERNLLNYTDI